MSEENKTSVDAYSSHIKKQNEKEEVVSVSNKYEEKIGLATESQIKNNIERKEQLAQAKPDRDASAMNSYLSHMSVKSPDSNKVVSASSEEVVEEGALGSEPRHIGTHKQTGKKVYLTINKEKRLATVWKELDVDADNYDITLSYSDIERIARGEAVRVKGPNGEDIAIDPLEDTELAEDLVKVVSEEISNSFEKVEVVKPTKSPETQLTEFIQGLVVEDISDEDSDFLGDDDFLEISDDSTETLEEVAAICDELKNCGIDEEVSEPIKSFKNFGKKIINGAKRVLSEVAMLVEKFKRPYLQHLNLPQLKNALRKMKENQLVPFGGYHWNKVGIRDGKFVYYCGWNSKIIKANKFETPGVKSTPGIVIILAESPGTKHIKLLGIRSMHAERNNLGNAKSRESLLKLASLYKSAYLVAFHYIGLKKKYKQVIADTFVQAEGQKESLLKLLLKKSADRLYKFWIDNGEFIEKEPLTKKNFNKYIGKFIDRSGNPINGATIIAEPKK